MYKLWYKRESLQTKPIYVLDFNCIETEELSTLTLAVRGHGQVGRVGF